MGRNWPNVTLDSICKIKSGKRLPKGHELIDVPTKYPYIRLVDVHDGVILAKELKYLTAEAHEKIQRYIVNENDVCLAIVGHTIGMVFFVDSKWNNVNLTENAARITDVDSKFNPKFIYYYLISPFGQAEIISRTVGSAQGKLPLYNIKSIELPCIPRSEQDSIVHILDCLDKKITLNRQINQTLEQMAQALFKSWFVDFDPVIDNSLDAGNEIPEPLQARAELRQTVRASQDFQPLPADVRALFPAEFEESELGWVPKGWNSTPVIELIELIGGGTPKTSIDEYWNGDIPWFSVVDAPNDCDIFVIDTEKHITQLGVDSSSTRILRKGTTIISARGTVGKCAFVARPMAMNQSCYGVIGVEGVTDEFVYYLLKQSVQELQQRSHGSVFSTITRDTFRSIQVPFSGGSLTRSFSSLVSIMFEKVLANNLQNIELIQLRDTLLPKLISGELRLDEITSP